MSDVFEGPGFWMASDGKWYPPERHPDPAYRDQFVPAPAVVPQEPAETTAAPENTSLEDDVTEDSIDPERLRPPAIPSHVAAESDETADDDAETPPGSEVVTDHGSGETEPGDFPSVELHADPPDAQTSPSPTSLFDIHHVAASDESGIDVHNGAREEPSVGEESEIAEEPEIVERPTAEEAPASTADEATDARSEPAIARADSSRTETPSFSVGTTNLTQSTERPVFDVTPPRSVAGPPGHEEAGSGIELELDWAPPSSRPNAPGSGSSAELSTSTALVVIPSTTHSTVRVSLFDRLLAATIFCAGVAMIVGTFLEWTTGSLTQTGWERGDGIATIIAGVIGSATAGPIYVGFHHIAPKSIAIICGLVGLVVVGLSAASVLFDAASAGTSTGVGFIVVLVGAASMTLAGLAHRVDLLY